MSESINNCDFCKIINDNGEVKNKIKCEELAIYGDCKIYESELYVCFDGHGDDGIGNPLITFECYDPYNGDNRGEFSARINYCPMCGKRIRRHIEEFNMMPQC